MAPPAYSRRVSARRAFWRAVSSAVWCAACSAGRCAVSSAAHCDADADAAGEVTQQVFLKLMREMTRFRGDAAFSTWLYRLVVNACVDRSRSRRRDAVGEDPAVLDRMATHPSHEEFFARREVAESVQHAIATLPGKLRVAILLRYFEDLSYADMAAALNCSIGTVASRLSRGHRLLAKRLAPMRSAIVGQVPPEA